MHAIIDFFLNITANLGYSGIFALMTVESSFIPFPSEIVVPPAAFLAAQGEMNLIIVIILGILGSLTGALINYYLAQYLGRPLIYKILDQKWTRFLLIDKEKMLKAENYFRKHGKVSTFIGRLIPGIRQLISIPAGIVKMPLGAFLFYTALGSGIWVTILAFLGFYLGSKPEIVEKITSTVGLSIIGLLIIALIGFLIYKKSKKNKISSRSKNS